MSLISLKYADWGKIPGGRRPMKGAISFLNSAFAVIGSGLSAAGTSLKVARMASALSNLSDYQLAEIGIKRSDIRRRAENLVTSENGDL